MVLAGDLWQFDTELSQYTKLAALPSPRTRYGAAILDGKLYLVGGFSSNDSEWNGSESNAGGVGACCCDGMRSILLLLPWCVKTAYGDS